MCDYCSCRSMPVIDELGADHEALLARSDEVERAIASGSRARARASFGRVVDDLRVHTAVEEASVFAALRRVGEMVDHVEALAGDHGQTWADVDALAGVDGAAWDVGVLRLLDELRDHIGREEYDLFPATLLAIGLGEWDAIERAAAGVRADASRADVA